MLGAPVQPGQLAMLSYDPIGFFVIARAGSDLGALEQLANDRAKAAGIAPSVQRKTVRDTGWDRAIADILAKDVDAEDLDAIDASPGALLIGGGERGIPALRALGGIAKAVADAGHGWVLDPSTAQLRTADRFAAVGASVDVHDLIMVHGIMGDNQQPSLDTMGMRRLGVPDLTIARISRGSFDRAASLVIATAQALVDRHDVTAPGKLVVENPPRRAVWGVRWAKPEHPSDALMIELVPPGGPTVEGLEKVLDGYFGPIEDKPVDIKADDPDLLAAAVRARKELAALRAHFAGGVPAKEQLAVKAPFRSPDGKVEWMWVDVVAFAGNQIKGTLDNDPDVVTTLHAGSEVAVSFDDVADFLYIHADGTRSGGYSVEVMRKRGLIPP